MHVAMDGSGSSATVAPPDTSPAQAWIDAKNNARQSVTVQPGATLTAITNNTNIENNTNYTVQDVEAANPQINPDLVFPGQTVYLPEPPQVVNGVPNSQTQPIIIAMANANAADQAVRDAQDRLTNAASGPARQQALQSLQRARAASVGAWNEVQQATFEVLMNNNGGAFPDQTAAAQVKQLNDLEPGNANFAAANMAALKQATQQWAQLGITTNQLQPILDAYKKDQQAKNALDQYLTNPDPDPAADHRDFARFTGDVRKADAALQTQIEATLTDVANRAGSDPAARSNAMTTSAGLIQAFGPQDPAFQTAVDNADYDLQVAKPAAEVAAAYAKGGALAAADKLKTVTQNAGSPYYASKIIQASKGTIDAITTDMVSPANERPPEVSKIYADLSQSVKAADTIVVSGSGEQTTVALSPDTQAAVDTVANSIAQYGSTNDTVFWNNDDNITLTLATAAALERQGKSKFASLLMDGATGRLHDLQSKTQSDVAAFATTIGPVDQLRATWGQFMTKDQLDAATNGYLADHPDVRQAANDELGTTISNDGDAIVAAKMAWLTYGASLDGIDGHSDLSSAAASLIGDPTLAFAVSQSNKMGDAIAIAAALGPAMPSLSGGGTVVQDFYSSEAWRLPRAARLLVAAYTRRQNAPVAQANENIPEGEPKLRMPFGPGTATVLSGIALVLAVEAAVGGASLPLSPQNVAFNAYAYLGITNFSLQTAAGFARLGGQTPAPGNLANVPETAAFRALQSGYFAAGALANFFELQSDLSQQHPDVGDAIFNGTQGTGNTISALRPLFTLILDEGAVDTVVAPLGAVLTTIGAAGITYNLLTKSEQDAQAFQQDSSKFLQDGLGLNPDLAMMLTRYGEAGNIQSQAAPAAALLNGLGVPSVITALPTLLPDSQSQTAAALLAYAHDHHMGAGELMQQLNQEPIDEAEQPLNAYFNLRGPARIPPAPQPAPQPGPPPSQPKPRP
jgi:hypothetical protein